MARDSMDIDIAKFKSDYYYTVMPLSLTGAA